MLLLAPTLSAVSIPIANALKLDCINKSVRLMLAFSAVARELGVQRSVLKRWVDNFAAGRYEKDRALPLKAAQQLENEQLRLRRIESGQRTSLTSGPAKAGSSWPWWWICSVDAWSAGRCSRR